MKRKWVLLACTITMFLLMFYIAFKTVYFKAYYYNSNEMKLSWLTEGLRNLNLVSEEAMYVANPNMVIAIILLMVVVFLTYTLFTLFTESWFSDDEHSQEHESLLIDADFYKKDNEQLTLELNNTTNLVIAIDDVSLFLNIDLLNICSEKNFIMLSKDIIEQFQHATEIVKSPEMKERYELILSQLKENTNVRAKIIYYQGSDEVMSKYYLDRAYPADKFLASCLSAAEEDNLLLKVVSRNESIIYKAKQLGFSTFKLSSLLDESKEVDVWETEENRGILH